MQVSLDVKDVSGGVHLRIHVKPRASRGGVGGVRGDALDVAVSASPVDGAANQAVIAVLARHFGVPKRSVTLVQGLASRTKIVRLEGLSSKAVLERVSPGPR